MRNQMANSLGIILSALTLTNSTLSGNRALGNGGGIDALTVKATTRLVNVTLADNRSENGMGGGLHTDGNPFELINTLIANDAAGGSPDCSGTITSLGYNLILSTSGCTISGTLTGVITNTDPLIGPLQDNGGSTWTHALLKDSPAINAGNPNSANCPSIDQRGVVRLLPCDIGAYEYVKSVYLPLALK